MEKNKYSELSNEALQKKIKETGFLIVAIAVFCIVIFLMKWYNGKTGWSLFGVPLPFSLFAFISYNSLKEMKKELMSRN